MSLNPVTAALSFRGTIKSHIDLLDVLCSHTPFGLKARRFQGASIPGSYSLQKNSIRPCQQITARSLTPQVLQGRPQISHQWLPQALGQF